MSDVQNFETLFPTTWDPTAAPTPQSPGPVAPRDFTDPGILYPNLPAAQRSMTKKYRKGNNLAKKLDTPVYNALQIYDQKRVQQGKSPLSAEVSAKVATAAQQNRAVTPEPKKNLIEAFGADLTNLVTSIPRLPGQLISEIEKIPEVPRRFSEIQRTAPNPFQALGEMAQLPGVNLLPGTFTASNILTGNPGEILKHPLFTALDILPYASKGAKSTKVFKAAQIEEAGYAAQRSVLSEIPIPAKAPNPFTTLLTKRLDDAGSVTPNRFGQAVSSGKRSLASTRPGQFATDAWGKTARESSRVNADVNKQLHNFINPDGPITTNPRALYVREVNSLDREFPNITAGERWDITRRLTNPVDDLGNPVKFSDGLDGELLLYATKLKDLSERSKILSIADDGTDALARREWNGSEEIFNPRQARQLDRLQKLHDDYAEKVASRANYDQAISELDTTRLGYNAVRDALSPHARTRPQARVYLDALKRGDYTKAKSTLTNMTKSAAWKDVLPDDVGIIMEAFQTLDDIRIYAKARGKLTGFTTKNLARRAGRVQKLRNQIVPARFGEVQAGAFKGALRERVVRDFTSDPQFNALLEHVDQGNYSSVMTGTNITPRDLYSLQKEVNSTVASMKLAGVDPVFMHRVSPGSVKGSLYPKITDLKTSPSSLRSRTLDATPYVPDLGIALSHQGLEFLQQQGNVAYIKRLGDTWGRPKAALREEYVPSAQAELRRNPQLNINSYIENEMAKDGWTMFDPDSYQPGKRSTGKLNEQDAIMIPSTITRNLERLRNPPKLIAAIDPVMNLFRTTVLALSPRWLVNNIFGGAMFSLAEQPNIWDFVRNLPAARRLVKSGEFHEIPGMGEGVFDISQEDVLAITRKTSEAEKIAAIYHHSAGRWAKDLFDNAVAQRAAKMGKGVVQGSYSLNSWFDNIYRADAYLTGKGRGLRKGMTEQAAREQGIVMARKIMQNWDEITPIERTVLRYVFPFYGFMQHVGRYVMQYPFDHPWRTAILGSFARNEMEDMGTGLPQRFLSMAFIGEMDENGNQKALSLGGANPFAAVANMWTLGGVLGSFNPIISSFAESMGLDPSTGNTSLFPSQRYNPETGRLEAKQQNYFKTLGLNLLPWAAVANDTLFDNAEFKQLLKTDPGAAGRMVMSQTGVPILVRNVNVPEEIIKAEKNRIDAEAKAKAVMLRTGNYKIANEYTGLQTYLGQLQALQKPGGVGTGRYQAPVTPVANPFGAVWAVYDGQQAQLQP